MSEKVCRETVNEQITTAIVESLALDDEMKNRLRPHTVLDKDLGVDSMDFVDLEFRMERLITGIAAKPFKFAQGQFAKELLGEILTEEQQQRIDARQGQGILDEIGDRTLDESLSNQPFTLERLQGVAWKHLQLALQESASPTTADTR